MPIMNNIVITINDSDDVTDLSSTTNPPPNPPKLKRKWTPNKEKNMQQIQLNMNTAAQKTRRDVALTKAVALLDYVDIIA